MNDERNVIFQRYVDSKEADLGGGKNMDNVEFHLTDLAHDFDGENK